MSLELQFDGGNTRLKWRLLSSDGLLASGAETYDDLSVDEFVARECFEGLDCLIVAAVKLSPKLDKLVAKFKESYERCLVLELKHDMLDQNQFAYADFSRLGIDRCLAMLGAYQMVGRACLVVDAGSAITADIVDERGVHLGGYIFPGVGMLKASLLQGTSKIHVKEEVQISYEPGKTTEQCVSHAMDLMLKSMLDSLFGTAKTYNASTMVLTGGDANQMSQYAESTKWSSVVTEKDLVFMGIDSVLKNRGALQ